MVNYVAVLVAALASFFFGWLWYGALFAKTFMKLSGKKSKDMHGNMTKSMTIEGVTHIVRAWVVSIVLVWVAATTMNAALWAGFYVWLGFVATVTAGGVAWNKEPWGLWVLNNGHHLVSILIVSGILVSWPQ